MDAFDKYLYEELVTLYERQDLSDDDYEELYQRFCGIDYLEEVYPYLLTMRFWGLGTESEKENVLSELKEHMDENNYILNGLYYDLLLSQNSNNEDALKNLEKMTENGYTDRFTKEKSHIKDVMTASDLHSIEKISNLSDTSSLYTDEEVIVDHIVFISGNYEGLKFTAGDVDYLRAKVFIRPVHGKKHIKVRSQIFKGDTYVSEIMNNEYEIDSATTWFLTGGWGNNRYTCYSDSVYKWVVEIDGKIAFNQNFRMYEGKLDQIGPRINDIKLVSSKWSGMLEKDKNNYQMVFDAKTLEAVYFVFLLEPLNRKMNIRVCLTIVYLEDNTISVDDHFLEILEEDTVSFWEWVGFSTPGKWEKGLYKYYIIVGSTQKYEGTFTVY